MVTIHCKEPQHQLFLPYDWHYIMNFRKCQQIFETNFIFFVHIKFIFSSDARKRKREHFFDPISRAGIANNFFLFYNINNIHNRKERSVCPHESEKADFIFDCVAATVFGRRLYDQDGNGFFLCGR